MAVGSWLRRRCRPVILAVLVVAVSSGLAWYLVRERRKTDRLLAEGEQALAARDYAQARELLNRYLADRPDDSHARLLAARAARRERLYHEAREHLRRSRADGGDS